MPCTIHTIHGMKEDVTHDLDGGGSLSKVEKSVTKLSEKTLAQSGQEGSFPVRRASHFLRW